MSTMVKNPAARRFLREKQVRTEFFPMASSTLWRMVNDGTFPPPKLIGPKMKGWFIDDLEAWAAQLPYMDISKITPDLMSEESEE